MGESQIRHALSNLSFTRPLPERVVNELSTIGEERDFSGGALIFKEGEEHPLLYIVCSGIVALDMHVPGRGDVRLLSVGPGDLLGWSPIVGNGTMTATATAQEPTRTVAISGEQLNRICEADYEIGYHVARQVAAALSQRLLMTRLQLLDLFAETTPVSSNPVH